MSSTDWIQTIGLFLTISALYFSISHNKKQLKLTLFSDYTRRYQMILLNLPERINEPDFSIAQLNPDERDKVLRYMRAYFDLCSEEYDLFTSHNLEKRVWYNWKSGIEYSFSKTAFKDAWAIVQLDTRYYPEFNQLVKDILKNQAE